MPSANHIPSRDSVGARAAGSGEQFPALPGLSQDCPGGQEGTSQQVSSTQLPDMQSVGSSHAPPFGTPVLVGVTVGVDVGVDVGVCVMVGLAVAVLVGVDVGVGVLVGLAVAVLVGVGVSVDVGVGVLVGVAVDVGVAVEVGVGVEVDVGVTVGVAVGAAHMFKGGVQSPAPVLQQATVTPIPRKAQVWEQLP